MQLETTFCFVCYHKIAKISPGPYIFQRLFLRGVSLEGLIFRGTYTICITKSIASSTCSSTWNANTTIIYLFLLLLSTCSSTWNANKKNYMSFNTVFAQFYFVIEGNFQVKFPWGLYSQEQFN